jgi:hypothetical protein
MPLNDQHPSSPQPQPLDYARPHLTRIRAAYAAIVAVVILLAGAIAAWCTAHSIFVLAEFHRVSRSQPIDFDDSYLGMPAEQSIPLGVFTGGVAIVALIHLVRVLNSRRRHIL